ncbi:MAG: hypothetical protein ABF759_14335 [Acetobacter malorum]|uniref:hypothetical protein n=1 Tax=Acetobacter malorum TaxID=178901 RepID=UPI0039EBD8A4
MTETTTALVAIQSAYPAQYYGQYDTSVTGTTRLTGVIDVWNGVNINGAQINLLGLPAASTLVALTAEQYKLASSARNVWVSGGKLLWPERYYASYDTTAAQPTSVTGWFDAWLIGGAEITAPPATLPDAASMVAVTADQWDDLTFHVSIGKGVKDGAIIDYTPPAAPVPLATQAATALASARTYVSNTYTMLNETTPDAWVTYLKALMAIVGGTDTTSTALPDRPTVIVS